MSDQDAKAKDEGSRSFAVFLSGIAAGECHAECSDLLRKLTIAMRKEALRTASAAKGRLSLNLDITVEPNGMGNVAFDVKIKEPKPKRSRGIVWVSAGGNLTLKDESQQPLPFRDVSAPSRETKDVPPAGAPAADA